ncbi:unnamed protein product [Lactuca virosa]|uniref:Uncharacterized protein n=1 Tax=Lactuca virosa TaxID=75947 RepID=A0AAU9LXW1_9ASTR|nr:unnamed protein product [Lactuca virosa]
MGFEILMWLGRSFCWSTTCSMKCLTNNTGLNQMTMNPISTIDLRSIHMMETGKGLLVTINYTRALPNHHYNKRVKQVVLDRMKKGNILHM